MSGLAAIGAVIFGRMRACRVQRYKAEFICARKSTGCKAKNTLKARAAGGIFGFYVVRCADSKDQPFLKPRADRPWLQHFGLCEACFYRKWTPRAVIFFGCIHSTANMAIWAVPQA